MTSPRLATAAEMPRLCLTAMRAFADDPILRWLYPDDQEYEGDRGGVFRIPMIRWLAHGHTWTTDDAVAVAAWVPPGRPEVDVDVGPIPDHPSWRLARFDALRGVMVANTPSEPHWYLNLLATHPDWQRQGLGTALMDAMFERCRRRRRAVLPRDGDPGERGVLHAPRVRGPHRVGRPIRRPPDVGHAATRSDRAGSVRQRVHGSQAGPGEIAHLAGDLVGVEVLADARRGAGWRPRRGPTSAWAIVRRCSGSMSTAIRGAIASAASAVTCRIALRNSSSRRVPPPYRSLNSSWSSATHRK